MIVKTRTAFSLVEVLVVMGIIAVLVGLGVAGISITQRAARDENRKVVASEIVSEINDQFRLTGRYPKDGPTGELQWTATQVTIGNGGVVLDGPETYSSTLTDSSQTRFVYIKDSSGFILCTLLESGVWHKLGSGLAQCPTL